MSIVTSAIARIESFAELEEDWDGYGAEKTSILAVAKAKEVWAQLEGLSKFGHFIYPDTNGGVAIDFPDDFIDCKYYLEVEIDRDGSMVAYGSKHIAPHDEEWRLDENFEDASWNRVRDFIELINEDLIKAGIDQI